MARKNCNTIKHPAAKTRPCRKTKAEAPQIPHFVHCQEPLATVRKTMNSAVTKVNNHRWSVMRVAGAMRGHFMTNARGRPILSIELFEAVPQIGFVPAETGPPSGRDASRPEGWAERSEVPAKNVFKEWWWKGRDVTPSALKDYDEYIAHVIMVNLRMVDEQGTDPDKYRVDRRNYTREETKSYDVTRAAYSDLVRMYRAVRDGARDAVDSLLIPAFGRTKPWISSSRLIAFLWTCGWQQRRRHVGCFCRLSPPMKQ